MAKQMSDLAGRVAIITGSSRGIGRECALALAREKVNIVVAAKSEVSTPNLPGSIHTVADEVKALGVDALAVRLDLRDEKSIDECVKKTIEKFGRVDILVNNASALWWKPITETPAKKYDLINSINSRGSFLMTQACLPTMAKNGFGRVICMSPPITFGHFNNRTAYNMSKYGMTMVALGVSQEYKGSNITGNSLWPATVIESQASKNFALGDQSGWRKASILADATVEICKDSVNGGQLIDDTYLQTRGWTDFVKYRCVADVEPPRLLDPGVSGSEDFISVRGDVKELEKDIKNQRSKL